MGKKEWKAPLLKKLDVLLTENGAVTGTDKKGKGSKKS